MDVSISKLTKDLGKIVGKDYVRTHSSSICKGYYAMGFGGKKYSICCGQAI